MSKALSQIEIPLATSDYTLHIALTNLPQKNSRDYINHIKKKLFDEYKKQSNDYLGNKNKLDINLFEPLQYYIFGNYDIAFISLIDRFKFSQKLFVPKKDETSGNSNFDPSAFQVITGICPKINDDFRPEEFFSRKLDSKNFEENRFVTICNLKLNNKLLIGNGTKFYDQVVITINKAIKEVFNLNNEEIKDKYFIMQSFSWFEVSVVLFTKTIESQDKIKNIIGCLRILTLDDLDNACISRNPNCLSGEQIYENSIYEKIVDKSGSSKYCGKAVFLFADSHSYIGVHKDVVENDIVHSEDIRSQIEAQLKPGHLKDFKKNIAKIKSSNGKPIYKETDPQFLITGKYDYQFQLKGSNISTNLALMKAILTPGPVQDKFAEYTRKIKTNIIFDYEPKQLSSPPDTVDFKRVLKERFVQEIDIGKINSTLKKLKISRLLRGKVLKIFYNYTNTIQDSILFIFLLDFVDFINYLRWWIDHQGELYDKKFDTGIKLENEQLAKVNTIENHLLRFVEIFQMGYVLRFLNSYQFEDINDFDLDFNSSPQQILTAYNSIAKEMQKLFFGSKEANTSNLPNFGNFPNSPVIQINLKNTVATAFTINYDVYHLICPEFVLFTLIKEILNKYYFAKSNNNYNDIDNCCQELQKKLIENKYFNSLAKNGLSLLDINNIFIDYIRLTLIFDFDYKMFYTWSWLYNFQNAAMYDEIGLFNEDHFRKELLRILFIGYLSNNESLIEKMECPIPELQVYWNRHFQILRKTLEKLFSPTFQTPGQNLAALIEKLKESTTQLLRGVSMDFYGKDEFLSASILENEIILNHGAPTLEEIFNGANSIYKYEYKSLKEKLEKGCPILFDPEKQSSYLYFFQICYTYLRYIYEENKEEVHLLRRNWGNGDPLIGFIQIQNNDWLYNIDQMGGVFFTNNEKAKTYFKVRNAMIQSLWHFGMVLKKKHFFK